MTQFRIPFVKPTKPNMVYFNKLLKESINQDRYTNFGPNEQKLTKYLEDKIGYKVICTANATLALDGLHDILSRKVRTAYLPSFTFPATNLGCRVKDIIYSTTDKDGFAYYKNIKKNSYVITTVPFGVRTVTFRPDDTRYWIIDAAAAASPDMSLVRCYFLERADAVVVSLHATKTLSACEGGFIAFNNNKLYEEYKKYINFGWKNIGIKRNLIGYGSNHKMSELSAAWCLMSIKSFNQSYQQRIKVTCAYNDMSKELNLNNISSRQAYWIQLPYKSDKFIQKMAKRGVDCRSYYFPHLGNKRDKVGKLMSENGVCLPTYELNDKELKYVIKCFKECL